MAARKKKSESTVAERLVSAREALGLSTAQLARRLGVQTRTLSAWETGASEPRSNRLVNLAGVLDVSPAWLLGGDGSLPAGGHDEITLLKGELHRLRSQQDETTRLIDRIENHVEALARKIADEA